MMSFLKLFRQEAVLFEYYFVPLLRKPPSEGIDILFAQILQTNLHLNKRTTSNTLHPLEYVL